MAAKRPSLEPSFYWYDYETFGTDPALDRPAQFAGQRTDLDLNLIGDPLLIYCGLADDYLPDPGACRVTGITPDTVASEGLRECDFIGQIRNELAQPATCNVGYNNIRFDDEFSRFTLYRNFLDAYEHEWKDGNTRWDMLDIVRLTRALRPEGINWPYHTDGSPSNRLEDITKANGIDHINAHDALADVIATIEVAKLIKTHQPQLFQYAFETRVKPACSELLNLAGRKPLIHVSGMYPGIKGHTAVVTPVALHPTNRNGIIVFDLSHDPTELIDLALKGEDGQQEIADRLFTRNADMPEGVTRMPLKTVHINRAPVLAPMGTLDDASAERLGIDKNLCIKHFKMLESASNPREGITRAMSLQEFGAQIENPDAQLYGGSFFNAADKKRFKQIRHSDPAALRELTGLFDDSRVDEMLFRYRARNFPETLNSAEQEDWKTYCREILTGADKTNDSSKKENSTPDNNRGNRLRSFQQYFDLLDETAWNDDEQKLKETLIEYGQRLKERHQIV